MKDPTDEIKAGTGFMLNPIDALKDLEAKGYNQQFVPRYDHLEAHCGKEKLFPEDFVVDEMIRFENTSDPNDQSILYAISCERFHFKGTFLESFGLYHEDFSAEMLLRLGEHLH